MNNEVPLKYYDIADEYATETAKPVSESEREPLARYFELLLTRLMNNEEMKVIKRSGEYEDVSFDKILKRIKSIGLEDNIQINLYIN